MLALGLFQSFMRVIPTFAVVSGWYVVLYLQTSCSCGKEVSWPPCGNLFKFGTDVHLNSFELIRFGWSKVKVTHCQVVWIIRSTQRELLYICHKLTWTHRWPDQKLVFKAAVIYPALFSHDSCAHFERALSKYLKAYLLRCCWLDLYFAVILLSVTEAVIVMMLIFLRSRLRIAIALLKEGSKWVWILLLIIKQCVLLFFMNLMFFLGFFQGDRLHHVHPLLPCHHLFPSGHLHRLLGCHSSVSFQILTNWSRVSCRELKELSCLEAICFLLQTNCNMLIRIIHKIMCNISKAVRLNRLNSGFLMLCHSIIYLRTLEIVK